MDKMWTDAAWEAFLDFQNDKKFLKKLNDLLKDIDRNGYSGLGKPEPLKDYLSGYWSRRIDESLKRTEKSMWRFCSVADTIITSRIRLFIED